MFGCGSEVLSTMKEDQGCGPGTCPKVDVPLLALLLHIADRLKNPDAS